MTVLISSITGDVTVMCIPQIPRSPCINFGMKIGLLDKVYIKILNGFIGDKSVIYSDTTATLEPGRQGCDDILIFLLHLF